MKTITIQVHPDRENEVMDMFSNADWVVISNQRCQETQSEIDENGERQYYTATFNKITFQREKDISIYDEEEMYNLIKEYFELLNDKKSIEEIEKLKPTIESVKPKKPIKYWSYKWLIIFSLLSILFVAALVTSIIADKTGNKKLFFIGDSMKESRPWIIVLSPSVLLLLISIINIRLEIKDYKKDMIKYNEKIEQYNNNPDDFLKPAMDEYEKMVEENNIISEKVSQLRQKAEEKSNEIYGHKYENTWDYEEYFERLKEVY